MNLSVGHFVDIESGKRRECTESQLPIGWKCGVYQLDCPGDIAKQFGSGPRCHQDSRRRRTETRNEPFSILSISILFGILLKVRDQRAGADAVIHIAPRRADAGILEPVPQFLRGRCDVGADVEGAAEIDDRGLARVLDPLRRQRRQDGGPRILA